MIARFRRTFCSAAAAVLIGSSLVAGSTAVHASIEAPRVTTGAYAGTLIDEGRPSPKEWVRFRVDRRQRVVDLHTRVWLQCYVYPNSYYQLPAVVDVPTSRIRNGRVDRSWRQVIELDGDDETLKGRVQLTFRGGRVTGRISIDVANCASRLGDPPYWVSLEARHC